MSEHNDRFPMNQLFRLIYHTAACVGLFAFLCALLSLLAHGGI